MTRKHRRGSDIVWCCQQNLAWDLTQELYPTWVAPRQRPCPGAYVIAQGLGRYDPKPEENWPKCEECGKTMLPLRELNNEEIRFSLREQLRKIPWARIEEKDQGRP